MTAIVDLSTEAKLQDAIAAALELEEVKRSAPEVAVYVFEHYRSLVDQWVLPRLNTWTLQQLAKLARPLLAPEPDPLERFLPPTTVYSSTGAVQQVLPGLHLTERLPLQSGKYIPVAQATIAQLRETMRAIRTRKLKRLDPKLEYIQSLINAMQPYARTTHGLTVEQYCIKREFSAEPAPRKSKRKLAS